MVNLQILFGERFCFFQDETRGEAMQSIVRIFKCKQIYDLLCEFGERFARKKN
jgi:hypothetical protein